MLGCQPDKHGSFEDREGEGSARRREKQRDLLRWSPPSSPPRSEASASLPQTGARNPTLGTLCRASAPETAKKGNHANAATLMNSVLRRGEKRQEIRPFCHAEGEGHSGADLAGGVIVDPSAAYSEVYCNIVLHLP